MTDPATKRRSLFSFRIGGVQEFIDSARTTEDFWAKSYLISHLSETAVKTINRQPSENKLIFPVPEILSNPTTTTWQGRFPNGVLAVIQTGQEKILGDAVQDAIQNEWQRCADEARSVLESHQLLTDEVRKIWNRQITRSTFETYWAAVSWAETESYGHAYRRISSLLEARKTLRDFAGANEPHVKCSQCGKLQSLQPHEGHNSEDSRKYWEKLSAAGRQLRHRFRANEMLCAVCLACRLAKRVFFDTDESFPSTSFIAAAPFRKALIAQPSLLVPRQEFARAISRLNPKPAVSNFESLDGDWLFPGTYDGKQIQREFGADLASLSLAKSAFHKFRETWNTPPLDLGAPFGYVALLTADGDKIGDRINKIARDAQDHSPHQQLSNKLSQISAAVTPIIESECLGRMVYSGGDDILALLPAATAVRALQLCIEKVRTPDLMGPDFSMSASLLIFPHTDSLSGAIREGAHLMRAEAKNRFNRGSVVITSRRQSGKKTMAALPWLAGTESSLSALNLLINAMAAEPSKQHAISGRIVGQFAELEPGLHGVQPLSVAAMAQSLLKRHSNASKDSKEFADQSKAIEVLADAAYEMAKKTHHEFPQASLLLETLIMARFLSRPSEGQ